MTDETTTVDDGWKTVNLDWSDIPPVRWDEQDQVEGVVDAARYIPIDDGHMVRYVAVLKLHTENGEQLVWESARLADFFALLRRGDKVRITFTNFVGLSGGRKMRRFRTQIQPKLGGENRSRVLGERPAPRPSAAQLPLPLGPGKVSDPEPEGFDDEIPF